MIFFETFVFVFLISWFIGWVFADPSNHFLDSIKKNIKDDGLGYEVSLRQWINYKLDSDPGSGTFLSELFSCKVCLGSWVAFFVTAIFWVADFSRGHNFFHITKIYVMIWIASILVNYILNIILQYFKRE